MGNNIQSEDTLEKFNAVGNIPVGDFFALSSNILNPNKVQEFNFIGPTSSQAYLYSKMYDSPYIYKHSPGQNYYMGSRCTEGQLILFTFCDSSNDKSTCKTNMFDNLWQVHSRNNYPIAKDFYIDDMDFYWSYSCYKAYTTYSDIEKNYLYNGQCVGYDVSLGKGEKFETQKYCLSALEDQKEEERIAQEKAEAERQEQIRIANLEKQCKSQGGTFKVSTEKCTLPTPKTPTTPTDNTDTTNVDDTSTVSEPDNTDDTTSDSTTDTNTDSTKDSTPSCNAYEINENGDCSFSFSKIFTTKGFVAYWDENPLAIVLTGIIILIVLVLVIPNPKKGGKKK